MGFDADATQKGSQVQLVVSCPFSVVGFRSKGFDLASLPTTDNRLPLLPFPQLAPQDFADGALGERVEEFDVCRQFVFR